MMADIDIVKELKEVNKKLDLLNEITIKNGGGRHITYRRSEFFQLMYDKHSLIKISDNLSKYAFLLLVVLQIIFFFVKK